MMTKNDAIKVINERIKGIDFLTDNGGKRMGFPGLDKEEAKTKREQFKEALLLAVSALKGEAE